MMKRKHMERSDMEAFFLGCHTLLSDSGQGLSLDPVKRCGGPPSVRGIQFTQVWSCSCCSGKEGSGGGGTGLWYFSGGSWGQECGWKKGSAAMLLSSAQDCSCCPLCLVSTWTLNSRQRHRTRDDHPVFFSIWQKESKCFLPFLP